MTTTELGGGAPGTDRPRLSRSETLAAIASLTPALILLVAALLGVPLGGL